MAINQLLKDRNILNGLSKTDYIYKYMPLKYVISTIKNNELCIGKVKTWDDVYENFFLKEDFILPDGKIIQIDPIEQERIYGMCWTTLRESDAMWRIYSSNSKSINDVAIRIRTSVDRLFDAVYTSDACSKTTYIGNVKYIYKSELKKWLQGLDIRTANDLMSHVVESMFLKRKPFSHERETRIIILEDNDCGNLLKYKINFNILFDEFVIDPLITDSNKINAIAKKLLNAGVTLKKVKQSTLYTFYPTKVHLL